MILDIALILIFQLAGETLARAFSLPLPGPVLGMALLLAAFSVAPGLARRMGQTVRALLSHLSLLFVPAGVGVITHLAVLEENGVALVAALVISTLAAMTVTVLVFTALARALGSAEEQG